MSVEDGFRLIARRAQLMQSLPAGGKMAAVFADEASVKRTLAAVGNRVAIAALNGPQNTVISGEESAVTEILDEFKRKGVKSQALATSHAFHSPAMEPILNELDRAAGEVQIATPHISIISNLTGQLADQQTYADATYWSRHARQPVRFVDGLRAIRELGCQAFLEIGPQPTLIGMGRRCLSDQELFWLPSLRKGRDDWQMMLDSLSQLFVRGAKLDWQSFDQDYVRRRCDLPTYPFQRKRYWVDCERRNWSAGSTAGKTGENLHPLLGRRIATPVAERIYESQISASQPPMLSEHKVQDTVVVPGACYVDMALAAAAADGEHWNVENVTMLQPLVLTNQRVTLQTIVAPQRPGVSSFRMVSVAENEDGGEPQFVTHAAGELRSGTKVNVESDRIDLDAARERIKGEPFDEAWRRDQAARVGLQYGHGFSWADRNWVDGDNGLAAFRFPTAADRLDDHRLHPGLLDTMFQLLGSTLHDRVNDAFVPLQIGRVRLCRKPEGEMWALASLDSLDEQTAVGDVRVYSSEGELIAECQGLQLRRVARDWLRRVVAGPQPNWLYEMAWEPQALEPTNGDAPSPIRNPKSEIRNPISWLLLDDHRGLGQSLAERLAVRGDECRVVASTLDSNEIKQAVANFVADKTDATKSVVYLAGLDIDNDTSAPDFDAARQRGWGGVLDLVKKLVTSGVIPLPRLWLATRSCQAVGTASQELSLAQSPVWGMGRVIAVEHPELQCTLVDIDRSGIEANSDMLFGELTTNRRETQVAYREGVRYVARLRSAEKNAALKVPQGEPYRLKIKSKGQLDQVALHAAVRMRPGPGQVEIKVRATGLNFRDVLNVLDLYPGDPGPLGCECAGVVESVGAGVQNFKPGDEVLALAPASFATYAITLAEFVVRRPSQLSIEQAASLPIAFATVHYALRKLGQINQSSRVLIHSATGGVGLAAIQVARRAGAEIFATAGSETKRQYLRDMGIEHVMDSRSVDFAEQIMRATDGAGVDMVLNSLTGDAIGKGISVLAENGHFLELGKTDLWDQQRVSQVHPTATFHPIALDHMMVDQPQTVRELLAEVFAEIENKVLEALPLRCYAIQDTVEAFRHMARAEHID
ncbi:MAG TPA: polyketide synthase dehydratase domain-containing protein, partial [Pirellulales bacterium]|nr:polyketide synthase dehydratase domain-containing protein [Pirellulales bacterium]